MQVFDYQQILTFFNFIQFNILNIFAIIYSNSNYSFNPLSNFNRSTTFLSFQIKLLLSTNVLSQFLKL